jgi:Holliday junction resolvase RusA-like endonuclease
MTEYNIRVVGTPVAQPRPKVRIIGRGKGARGQAYVPSTHPVHAWRAIVGQAVKAVVWDKITEPVAVQCVFLMPRPKAMIWSTQPMPRALYAAKRNDGDNLLKAVFDSCNDAKIWDDDGQVVEGSFSRLYASGDEQPGVEITIRVLSR